MQDKGTNVKNAFFAKVEQMPYKLHCHLACLTLHHSNFWHQLCAQNASTSFRSPAQVGIDFVSIDHHWFDKGSGLRDSGLEETNYKEMLSSWWIKGFNNNRLPADLICTDSHHFILQQQRLMLPRSVRTIPSCLAKAWDITSTMMNTFSIPNIQCKLK